MFEFLNSTNTFIFYFLIFIRVSGIIFTAPFFGSTIIDSRLKIFLSLIMSILIFYLVPKINFDNITTLLLILVILKELLIGIMIGILGRFLFVGVQFGGQIIGFQMGFGVVNILDPQTNSQISIIAQFQNIVMILIFLSIGGHRLIIEAIVQCFKIVPLGTFVIPEHSYMFLVKTFSEIFVIALKIVAPVFVTLIITHVIMGIIARLVPQINILIVGFPIQIAAGLIVIIFSMTYFYSVFEIITHDFFKNVLTIFKILGV
ncbi:MAG: flagellar biosynthesis protein FliR [Deferribacteres bacterium]|jgi:flagellar biosynthetic protein FliR|nr:flagellar biosynthetic protein FliR [Deferribacteraceae bacterium]MDK2791152.1 flagellar biosynthesis protein FliR [Deferribacteres bacterium]